MSAVVDRSAPPGLPAGGTGVVLTWAAVFVPLSLLAIIGRIPDPWTPDPSSGLAGMSAAHGSWLITAVGLAVVVALAVGTTTRTAAPSRAAGRVLVVLGIVVAVVVSDVRALAFLGYLPMVLLALVGIGPADGHLEWDLFTNAAAALGHAAGGVAIAVTGSRLLDRSAVLCGRTPSWHAWVRWGRPAVAVAVAAPLCYAVTRIAWALDVPLGVRHEMLDELGSARYAGLGLALFAVVGAWLTTGLRARWGEVFWDWLPVVGGRPVPLALALVPGLVVAGAVLSAGLGFWRLLLTGHISEIPGASEDWAAWAPELLWPVWGVALAVACLAYLGRRTTEPGPGRSSAPARWRRRTGTRTSSRS